MGRRFHKMHGLGNDFVLFDARTEPVALSADQVRTIADRRHGVGCDQLIVLEPSASADVRMRIFNADGGEVEACGNAARCVVLLIGGELRIETLGGIIHGASTYEGVTVDLGRPRFAPDEIPVLYPMDTRNMPVGWEGLSEPFAVNVGNPHLVFFVPDEGAVELGRIGPLIERDPLFPQGVNVNVATLSAGGLRLRTWERGAGLTPACGTGACATAVAAISRKLLPSPVEVRQTGGAILVHWSPGENVRMTGPAVHVFTGELTL
ncbi:MAG TPA: diaminopimelate epimerase [Allosphingosinicella sp.]|jgi:diaminopimelate epimerase